MFLQQTQDVEVFCFVQDSPVWLQSGPLNPELFHQKQSKLFY